jgi:hypothetical protein
MGLENVVGLVHVMSANVKDEMQQMQENLLAQQNQLRTEILAALAGARTEKLVAGQPAGLVPREGGLGCAYGTPASTIFWPYAGCHGGGVECHALPKILWALDSLPCLAFLCGRRAPAEGVGRPLRRPRPFPWAPGPRVP